jgi:hypothetical protein
MTKDWCYIDIELEIEPHLHDLAKEKIIELFKDVLSPENYIEPKISFENRKCNITADVYKINLEELIIIISKKYDYRKINIRKWKY